MLDQLCLHCKIYPQQVPKRQIVRAAVTAVINTATGNVSANEELSERFRLPRGQIRGSTRPLPRGISGRFAPYTTAAKASNKSIAKSEIIIKDVCLLPSSCWEEVSRRHITAISSDSRPPKFEMLDINNCF